MDKEITDKEAEEKIEECRKKLTDDVFNNRLSYLQVEERYKELHSLIPFNWHYDFFALDDLIRKKYINDLDYQAYLKKHTYTFKFKDISQDEIYASIKKIVDKIKWGYYDSIYSKVVTVYKE